MTMSKFYRGEKWKFIWFISKVPADVDNVWTILFQPCGRDEHLKMMKTVLIKILGRLVREGKNYVKILAIAGFSRAFVQPSLPYKKHLWGNIYLMAHTCDQRQCYVIVQFGVIKSLCFFHNSVSSEWKLKINQFDSSFSVRLTRTVFKVWNIPVFRAGSPLHQKNAKIKTWTILQKGKCKRCCQPVDFT